MASIVERADGQRLVDSQRRRIEAAAADREKWLAENFRLLPVDARAAFLAGRLYAKKGGFGSVLSSLATEAGKKNEARQKLIARCAHPRRGASSGRREGHLLGPRVVERHLGREALRTAASG